MSPEIEILKHQAEFLESKAIHTGMVAGYGSGKSDGAVIKVISKKLNYPGVNCAYYLPTYPLIEDVAFPKFELWLNRFGVVYELNKQYKNIITPYGKIILRSMDKPERIIGYEVGYSLIDEADILPIDKMKDVFIRVIGRNRTKLSDGARNQTDMVGTPEGFRFLYDFFVKNGNKNRQLIKAKTSDNPFLPDGYIETLKETYSPEQLDAYLNGEFVNLTSGTVYSRFDRTLNHSDRIVQKHDILYVGMDFNIDNMSAVIHVIDENPIAVDEITKAHDTDSMCNILLEKYPKNRIIVYPDASGNNRSTNATLTDIKILERHFLVKARSKNPYVIDRVKNMNRLFCDGNGKRKYFVNTKKCPEYTEAIERLSYDKNGVPDKSSGFDHITEAAGYFLYYEYPSRGKQSFYW